MSPADLRNCGYRADFQFQTVMLMLRRCGFPLSIVIANPCQCAPCNLYALLHKRNKKTRTQRYSPFVYTSHMGPPLFSYPNSSFLSSSPSLPRFFSVPSADSFSSHSLPLPSSFLFPFLLLFLFLIFLDLLLLLALHLTSENLSTVTILRWRWPLISTNPVHNSK